MAKIEDGKKMFVISGLASHHDKITHEGVKTGETKYDGFTYYYVDGCGPYNEGFCFLDTKQNREAFQEFIRIAKAADEMASNAMYDFLRKVRS